MRIEKENKYRGHGGLNILQPYPFDKSCEELHFLD